MEKQTNLKQWGNPYEIGTIKGYLLCSVRIVYICSQDTSAPSETSTPMLCFNVWHSYDQQKIYTESNLYVKCELKTITRRLQDGIFYL